MVYECCRIILLARLFVRLYLRMCVSQSFFKHLPCDDFSYFLSKIFDPSFVISGMAQTGVPFGQVGLCRDFLKISGKVGKPNPEHPKRPIEGFQCRRSEPSGERFWSFFRKVCRTPENFAKHCIVYNHCPLVIVLKFLCEFVMTYLFREMKDILFSKIVVVRSKLV